MSIRYALLGDEWVLRGWKGAEKNLVRWRTPQMVPLDDDTFYVLSSCDGQTDFDSLAFLPAQKRKLERLADLGVVRPCEPGSRLCDAQRYRLAKNTRIFALLWSITGRCNFRCRHCFMDAPDRLYGECGTRELWELLDQMEAANVIRVALTGGEPLIRPDFKALIRELSRRRIGIVEIFTNGALVTDEILDCIEECGFHPVFKVSFDGAGSHDYMRGVKGAEEAALRGIRLLKKRNFETVIITSIDAVVAGRLKATCGLLKELGVDAWWMAPPVEVGCWENNQSAVEIDRLTGLLEELLLTWNREGRPMPIKLWRFGQFYAKSQGPAYRKPTVFFEHDTFNCFATHGMGYLMPDGKLIPCGSLTGTEFTDNMPNLFQTPLTEAWDTEELSACCNLLKGQVRARNPECGECQWFKFCGCGCRTTALLETGDYYHYDPVVCNLFKSGRMQHMWELAASLEDV